MRRHLGLTLTVVAAISLAGCGGGKVRSGGGSASGATFVYDYHLNVVTDWDPATSYSNEIIAMENIYDSLTTYDPTTKTVKPRLATSWRSSDGGKTWTFTLRSSVTFHDGSPVTSTAAKEAIERTISLKGGAAYIWDAVKSIDTPAPTTLVFHLSYPAPLDLISSSDYGAYIYDVHAAGGVDLHKWLGAGHDAGTGPYTIKSWDAGQPVEVKLVKFAGYWGGWSGRHFDALDFRVSSQVTTAWQLAQRKQVSFVDQLNPELFSQAKSTSSVQASSTASFQNLIALYNTAHGPLTDARIRKAVQSAIDTAGIVSALKGSVQPASGYVPAGLLGASTGLQTTQNLSEARSLLSAAGYGSGGKHLTLSMTYATDDDPQQLVVTLLSSALSALGVTLNAKPEQWTAQWTQAKSSNVADRQDIFLMYWYPDYADAYTWFANLFHSASPPSFNLTYLDDATIDAQIDQLPVLTATDRTKAGALYSQLQSELIDRLTVATPIYVQTYERVLQAGIEGYVDNPAYPDVVFVHDLTPSS